MLVIFFFFFFVWFGSGTVYPLIVPLGKGHVADCDSKEPSIYSGKWQRGNLSPEPQLCVLLFIRLQAAAWFCGTSV